MKKFVMFALLGCTALAGCENVSEKAAQMLPTKQPTTTGVLNQQAIVTTMTVAQAMQARDESQVRLSGKVLRALGDEKYEFADATGTMTVEIDDELWYGRALTANDVITITGEIDIDYVPTKRVRVDVDTVEFH